MRKKEINIKKTLRTAQQRPEVASGFLLAQLAALLPRPGVGFCALNIGKYEVLEY